METLKITKIERPTTLSNKVSEHLESLIARNELEPGGRLPTERSLAARFDVSRTVIREAVSALAAKGMLEVNAGSGTVVRRPSAKHVSQTISLYLGTGQREFQSASVTEVRRLLEVEIAGLAAERRSATDLADLTAILNEFNKAADHMDSYVKWDVYFHLRLAAATQNELLLLLLDSIGGIMAKVRQIGYHVPGANMQALHYHTTVFEQVKLGNREGARHAMREHIDHSENILQSGLKFL